MAAGKLSEINVTPLVDVLLVLLIIFMVTTAAAEQQRVEQKKQTSIQDKTESLVVLNLPVTPENDYLADPETSKLVVVIDKSLRVFVVRGLSTAAGHCYLGRRRRRLCRGRLPSQPCSYFVRRSTVCVLVQSPFAYSKTALNPGSVTISTLSSPMPRNASSTPETKPYGIRLAPLLHEGAKLILDGDNHPLLLAQRESCSCSSEERVPILQDIGIVEAPRLGAESRKTALPRIINTPEPSKANTVTTQKTAKSPDKKDKTSKKPSLDDLLNAASNFDDARPTSDVDPGGSPDGSRLSKSATGKGDPYLQKIKAKLDNTMNAPASIPKSQLQKLSAKIWIKVGDNGTVWAWDFVKKSGNAAFDKMIEMTIKQYMMGGTLKFATPPEQLRLQMIPINVDGRDI